ncbi:MAG: DUF6794 domain-containing protein [Pseudomonadota bacterium]
MKAVVFSLALLATDAEAQGRPMTCAAAIKATIDQLSPEERDALAALPRWQLFELHHGLGARVRNNLGLWNEDSAVRDDCARQVGNPHPDDISAWTVARARAKLRNAR